MDRAGADGNERLTAATGAVLLVLLAIEGVTIVGVGRLLTLHFFVGMLLLGPVCLKLCSTTYRFARYYTGDRAYREKGAPVPLLRVLGPFVALTTLGVFGSGIALAITGPAGRQPWMLVHKASFVLWFGLMSIHVLAYVWRLPRLISGDLTGRRARHGPTALGGRGTRLVLLVAVLAGGLVIALLTVHLAGPWRPEQPLGPVPVRAATRG